MSFDPSDPRIDEGIRLFNEQAYFECHDVFEDFWSELVGTEKKFFQGLIHAAVCLFHFEGGNLSGARKMYHSFSMYVGAYPADFCDIDLVRLMTEMETCFAELLAAKNGYPRGVELNQQKIPQIHRLSASSGVQTGSDSPSADG